MFTTLRLQSSLEDVGKGPSKHGNAIYHRAACVHCKRKKASALSCSQPEVNPDRCSFDAVVTARRVSAASPGTSIARTPPENPLPPRNETRLLLSRAQELEINPIQVQNLGAKPK